MIGNKAGLEGRTVLRLKDNVIFTIESTRHKSDAATFKRTYFHKLVSLRVSMPIEVAGDDPGYDLVETEAEVAAREKLAGAAAARADRDTVTITRDQLETAFNQATGSVLNTAFLGTSKYRFTVTGSGASLYFISLESEPVASMKWEIADDKAKVVEINTRKGYEGNGLAKLVAGAFFQHCKANKATLLMLGTNDTSGGFWTKLGMQQGGTTKLSILLAQNTDFVVTRDLKPAEFTESDRSRNTGMY